MASKKKADKRAAIQNFSLDLFDYVKRQYFYKPKKSEIENSDEKSQNYSGKDNLFNDNIGNAVFVSMYLLREYFNGLFSFTFPNSFKQEVKLMWSDWIKKRDNVFIKTVDTLAIIAEAAVYNIEYERTYMNWVDASEWFVEWFEETLAEEFYKKNGWKQFEKDCLEWYAKLFQNLNRVVNFSNSTIYSILVNCCVINNYMKTSAVSFPVLPRSLCTKCQQVYKDEFKKTVYVRTKREMIESFKKGNTEEVSDLIKVIISNYFERDLSEDERLLLKNCKHTPESFPVKLNNKIKYIQVFYIGKVFLREIHSKYPETLDNIRTAGVQPESFTDRDVPRDTGSDDARSKINTNVEAKPKTTIDVDSLLQAGKDGDARPKKTLSDDSQSKKTSGEADPRTEKGCINLKSLSENTCIDKKIQPNVIYADVKAQTETGTDIDTQPHTSAKHLDREKFFSKSVSSIQKSKISTDKESDKECFYLISEKYSNNFHNLTKVITQGPSLLSLEKSVYKIWQRNSKNKTDHDDKLVLRALHCMEIEENLFNSGSDMEKIVIVNYEILFVLVGKDKKKPIKVVEDNILTAKTLQKKA